MNDREVGGNERFSREPAFSDEATADVVTDLKDDVKAICGTQGAQETRAKTRMGNTAVIGLLLKDGSAVLAKLDAVILNKYTRQPDRVGARKSASHIDFGPQRESEPG